MPSWLGRCLAKYFRSLRTPVLSGLEKVVMDLVRDIKKTNQSETGPHKTTIFYE